MIQNDDLAAYVSAALREAFHILGQSLTRVNAEASDAEAALYREKVGDIFHIIVFGIQEPLYEDHPELKPQEWDG